MPLGAHVSAAGGHHKIFERGAELGCECYQLFTRAPSQWKAKPLKAELVKKFRALREKAGHPSVIAHDIYLNNLAAENDEIRRKSIETMVEELGRCFQLGIDGLVCHIGAHPEGPEVGLPRYASAIAEILQRTEDCPTPILLETCAGQGNNLGHQLEHLKTIIDLNHGNPRLGVCLDTCHVFAAGYDLREEQSYQAFWKSFDKLLGLDRLKAMHLNDSKKPLASRVDRHDHIGKGEIGDSVFKFIVTDPRFEHLPMVIETPEMQTMHAKNLRKLKRLRGKRKSKR